MNVLSKTLILALVGLGAAYGGSQLILSQRSIVSPSASTIKLDDDALIKQGAYVSRTGDCVACHTVPGGQKYAGGLAMQTPLGAIYSTNITPDKDTGIGNYTLDEFKTAVQHGVRKDGAALYPAMPYPSYSVMSDEDMNALYAYFMKGVPAVKQQNAEPTLPKLFQMRWTIAFWQWLFAPTDQTFVADEGLDDLKNRGAYLVQGPGHCGACHTPRGVAYQELALSLKDGDDYLSGAVIDGWRAKSLRGEGRGLASWSEDELLDFFATGRTDKVAAFGAMTDVVEHSTQYMTPRDQKAMAQYLKSLPPVKGRNPEIPHQADTTTQTQLDGQYTSPGAWLYAAHCVTCHRADGKGVPRVFPALAGNSAVFANNPQSVIQVTLEGGRMPENSVDTMSFTMPAFRHLGDQEIADLVNYIRTSWTNQAPTVQAADVAHIRQFVANKSPNILPQGASHE
ncbi:cytochrome c [Alcaligenes faecalis]|uniref:cytochrome c n=1 Tax=Alcaligenes faecalis TaxID=511 RepID=UPI00211BE5BD|nr:cytochrome c [Alcaligenes faecalis]UUO12867.1 cytochrome c [Alcaligenes faecalis]